MRISIFGQYFNIDRYTACKKEFSRFESGALKNFLRLSYKRLEYLNLLSRVLEHSIDVDCSLKKRLVNFYFEKNK